MKNLFYTLVLLPVFAIGQTVDDFSFVPSTSDNNMSVVFPAGTLNDFIGGELMAFKFDGSPVSAAFPVGDDGSGGIAAMGIYDLCDCYYLSEGDPISFGILMNGETIVIIDIDPPLTYQANGFDVASGTLSFTVDGFDAVFGCTNTAYLEYSSYANIDNGTCSTINVFGCTDAEANNYENWATQDDGSCVYFTPISYQLSSGWNMVGYTGTADNNGIVNQMDAALGNGAGTANTFQVIKNVSGAFWSAAFAQINTFTQGEGYMMFVNGDPTTVNFQQTSGYIPDILYQLSSGWNMVAFTGDINSENNILTAMDAALGNGAGTANTFQVIKNVSGAFWSAAFTQITEFTPGEAYMMFVNGSPTTVNFQRKLLVGDLAEGGIVFYVDETGEHGLVAAEEDLPEMYPWGCSGSVISGADGLVIGTGLQNTLDIVFGCSESPIAASMALEHENNGYSDWYLPSFDELMEMFNTIGNAGPNGNVGSFQDDWYISSSEFENDPTNVWGNNFSETFPNPGGGHKSIPNNIRLIRSF